MTVHRNHDGNGVQWMAADGNGDKDKADPFIPHSKDIGIDSALETSNRGTTGVGVFVQDQTTDVLSVPFLQTRATVTLAADTVIESRTIDLVTGHGTLFGEVIELAELDSGVFMQSVVIDPLGLAAPGDPVIGDTITLDQPVNEVYLAASAIAQRSTVEMNVDGSVTS